jgi:hypothetical protein
VRIRGFEDRAASAAFREQDFGDVVKRIDTCHMLDFLADKMDGMWIGDERHANAFGG